VAWLVGDADLAHWRGQLDYWVFVDGAIGRIAGSVNGDAADISEGALQATIRVDMTATDRDAAIRITPPTP
jgi:polyisoprenoid-binding protein YceI